MAHELQSKVLKGVIKGDTRSFDYRSHDSPGATLEIAFSIDTGVKWAHHQLELAKDMEQCSVEPTVASLGLPVRRSLCTSQTAILSFKLR